MPDSFPPEVRSRIMSKIRSKDTTPEKTVRSYLHRKGFRFLLHRKDLPGNPDLVFPKYMTVVFIHGCFWHQHPDKNCPHTGIPLSNKKYWEPKLKRTTERDKKNLEAIKKAGWRVDVVWECEISEERLQRLSAFIKGEDN